MSLSPDRRDTLFTLLRVRFEQHPARHPGLSWNAVQTRLENRPDKLRTLHEMETSGGEPDVVVFDEATGEIVFFDCSPETPKGRVSLCYDREGLESRKAHRPTGSALERAAAMGIELLTEEQYHALQALGEFDRKTSSWLATPAAIRRRGGALFGDRRYGRVFIYHNGAESYFAVRGFRGALRV
jgi:hypothetical protein